MKKPHISGWELTTNENKVEMATLPAQLLRDTMLYIEHLESNEQQARQDQTRKVLNEVIECVKQQETYPRDCFMKAVYDKLQSMLPKEEVDWSKASDKEKIDYADKNYSEGMVVINQWYTEFKDTFIIPKKREYNNFEEGLGISCYGWLLRNGKWAEIVSEPVKEECKKMCGENHCDANGCTNRKRNLTEPVIQDEEIKVGDDVEISDDDKNFGKYSHHKHKYVGAKRIFDGHFIVENQDGFISTSKFIRKAHTKRPSLVEAERLAKEFMQSDLSTHTIEPKLTELIEKLILKNKE